MAERSSDVIVVGGGIMGSCAAFFLRRRGRSVTLIERGLVGQQASGVNFGNVRRQGRFLPQLPLANRARETWGRLAELVGEDCEFLALGHMRVCFRPELVGQFEAYARSAREYGLELELLTPKMLRERFPYLGPDILAGSLSPLDGHANPRLISPAFARAARRLGAVIEENTEVLSIEKAGEDFHVETATGMTCRAPAVLVTAGAWSDRLCAAFGEPVPLTAHGPQMAVTEPARYVIEPSIGVSTPVTAESVYLRQIPRGNVIMGGGTRGPALPAICRSYVEPRNTLAQLGQFRRLVPALEKLHIIRVWTGIESYLPDDNPIMGPSARVPGLYYAFGFCGHGFQLGPGVGDVMAELIDTGATSTPIEPFTMARFQKAAAAA
jgi:glycine/D-amino acid oxidase-like deaminating enzyme